MHFLRNNIFGRTDFDELLSLPDGYGKEELMNSKFV